MDSKDTPCNLRPFYNQLASHVADTQGEAACQASCAPCIRLRNIRATRAMICNAHDSLNTNQRIQTHDVRPSISCEYVLLLRSGARHGCSSQHDAHGRRRLVPSEGRCGAGHVRHQDHVCAWCFRYVRLYALCNHPMSVGVFQNRLTARWHKTSPLLILRSSTHTADG